MQSTHHSLNSATVTVSNSPPWHSTSALPPARHGPCQVTQTNKAAFEATAKKKKKKERLDAKPAFDTLNPALEETYLVDLEEPARRF
jgi:hypothetical protein